MKKTIALVLCLIMCLASVSVLAEPTQTIEFFNCKKEVVEVWKEIIAKFEEENPDIHVVCSYVDDGETVLATRGANNDFPDVMQIYAGEELYHEWYDNGLIYDLAGYDFMQNVEQKMLDLTDYNGVQFSLPYALASYGIHYNKDIFAKLNLTEPTTLDEFLEDCKVIYEAGYNPVAFEISGQLIERTVSAFDNENYKELQKVYDGEMDIKDVFALKELAKLLQGLKPYVNDPISANGDDLHSTFIKQEAAMRFLGTFYLSSILAAEPEFEVGCFPIPSAKYETSILPVIIDTSFAIATSSTNKEACVKFVEFLSRKDIAEMYYAVDGNFNMIKGVAYDKEQYMPLYEKIVNNEMSLSHICSKWPDAYGVREGIKTACEALWLDDDIDEFFSICYDAVMECYGK